MGKLDRASGVTGLEIPASGTRTRAEDVEHLVDACQSEDASVRQLALRHLCTCHVQADDDAAWTTIVDLFGDEAVRVRAEALHAMTDSTPATRVQTVVDALEAGFQDPDPKLQRRIRKTLAHYRRTGKLTDTAN
jgi:hypothetical protein